MAIAFVNQKKLEWKNLEVSVADGNKVDVHDIANDLHEHFGNHIFLILRIKRSNYEIINWLWPCYFHYNNTMLYLFDKKFQHSMYT